MDTYTKQLQEPLSAFNRVQRQKPASGQKRPGLLGGSDKPSGFAKAPLLTGGVIYGIP